MSLPYNSMTDLMYGQYQQGLDLKNPLVDAHLDRLKKEEEKGPNIYEFFNQPGAGQPGAGLGINAQLAQPAQQQNAPKPVPPDIQAKLANQQAVQGSDGYIYPVYNGKRDIKPIGKMTYNEGYKPIQEVGVGWAAEKFGAAGAGAMAALQGNPLTAALFPSEAGKKGTDDLMRAAEGTWAEPIVSLLSGISSSASRAVTDPILNLAPGNDAIYTADRARFYGLENIMEGDKHSSMASAGKQAGEIIGDLSMMAAAGSAGVFGKGTSALFKMGAAFSFPRHGESYAMGEETWGEGVLKAGTETAMMGGVGKLAMKAATPFIGAVASSAPAKELAKQAGVMIGGDIVANMAGAGAQAVVNYGVDQALSTGKPMMGWEDIAKSMAEQGLISTVMGTMLPAKAIYKSKYQANAITKTADLINRVQGLKEQGKPLEEIVADLSQQPSLKKMTPETVQDLAAKAYNMSNEYYAKPTWNEESQSSDIAYVPKEKAKAEYQAQITEEPNKIGIAVDNLANRNPDKNVGKAFYSMFGDPTLTNKEQAFNSPQTIEKVNNLLSKVVGENIHNLSTADKIDALNSLYGKKAWDNDDAWITLSEQSSPEFLASNDPGMTKGLKDLSTINATNFLLRETEKWFPPNTQDAIYALAEVFGVKAHDGKHKLQPVQLMPKIKTAIDKFEGEFPQAWAKYKEAMVEKKFGEKALLARAEAAAKATDEAGKNAADINAIDKIYDENRPNAEKAVPIYQKGDVETRIEPETAPIISDEKGIAGEDITPAPEAQPEIPPEAQMDTPPEVIPAPETQAEIPPETTAPTPDVPSEPMPETMPEVPPVVEVPKAPVAENPKVTAAVDKINKAIEKATDPAVKAQLEEVKAKYSNPDDEVYKIPSAIDRAFKIEADIEAAKNPMEAQSEISQEVAPEVQKPIEEAPAADVERPKMEEAPVNTEPITKAQRDAEIRSIEDKLFGVEDKYSPEYSKHPGYEDFVSEMDKKFSDISENPGHEIWSMSKVDRKKYIDDYIKEISDKFEETVKLTPEAKPDEAPAVKAPEAEVTPKPDEQTKPAPEPGRDITPEDVKPPEDTGPNVDEIQKSIERPEDATKEDIEKSVGESRKYKNTGEQSESSRSEKLPPKMYDLTKGHILDVLESTGSIESANSKLKPLGIVISENPKTGKMQATVKEMEVTNLADELKLHLESLFDRPKRMAIGSGLSKITPAKTLSGTVELPINADLTPTNQALYDRWKSNYEKAYSMGQKIGTIEKTEGGAILKTGKYEAEFKVSENGDLESIKIGDYTYKAGDPEVKLSERKSVPVTDEESVLDAIRQKGDMATAQMWDLQRTLQIAKSKGLPLGMFALSLLDPDTDDDWFGTGVSKSSMAGMAMLGLATKGAKGERISLAKSANKFKAFLKPHQEHLFGTKSEVYKDRDRILNDAVNKAKADTKLTPAQRLDKIETIKRELANSDIHYGKRKNLGSGQAHKVDQEDLVTGRMNADYIKAKDKSNGLLNDITSDLKKVTDIAAVKGIKEKEVKAAVAQVNIIIDKKTTDIVNKIDNLTERKILLEKATSPETILQTFKDIGYKDDQATALRDSYSVYRKAYNKISELDALSDLAHKFGVKIDKEGLAIHIQTLKGRAESLKVDARAQLDEIAALKSKGDVDPETIKVMQDRVKELAKTQMAEVNGDLAKARKIQDKIKDSEARHYISRYEAQRVDRGGYELKIESVYDPEQFDKYTADYKVNHAQFFKNAAEREAYWQKEWVPKIVRTENDPFHVLHQDGEFTVKRKNITNIDKNNSIVELPDGRRLKVNRENITDMMDMEKVYNVKLPDGTIDQVRKIDTRDYDDMKNYQRYFAQMKFGAYAQTALNMELKSTESQQLLKELMTLNQDGDLFANNPEMESVVTKLQSASLAESQAKDLVKTLFDYLAQPAVRGAVRRTNATGYEPTTTAEYAAFLDNSALLYAKRAGSRFKYGVENHLVNNEIAFRNELGLHDNAYKNLIQRQENLQAFYRMDDETINQLAKLATKGLSLTSVSMLGFNPRSAIGNTVMGITQNTALAISKGVSLKSLLKTVPENNANALRYIMKGKEGIKYKDPAKQYIAERLLDYVDDTNAASLSREISSGKISETNKKVMDAAFSLSKWAEIRNRFDGGMLNASDLLAKKGLLGKKELSPADYREINLIIDKSKNFIDVAHGDYDFFMASMPEQKLMKLGPMGRVMLQLVRPGVNAFEQVIGHAKKYKISGYKDHKQLAALAAYGGAANFFGGIMAVPIVGSIAAATKFVMAGIDTFSGDKDAKDAKLKYGTAEKIRKGLTDGLVKAGVPKNVVDAVIELHRYGAMSMITNSDWSQDNAEIGWGVPVIASRAASMYKDMDKIAKDPGAKTVIDFLVKYGLGSQATRLKQAGEMLASGETPAGRPISEEPLTLLKTASGFRNLQDVKSSAAGVNDPIPLEDASQRKAFVKQALAKDHIKFGGLGYKKQDDYKKVLAEKLADQAQTIKDNSITFYNSENYQNKISQSLRLAESFLKDPNIKKKIRLVLGMDATPAYGTDKANPEDKFLQGINTAIKSYYADAAYAKGIQDAINNAYPKSGIGVGYAPASSNNKEMRALDGQTPISKLDFGDQGAHYAIIKAFEGKLK